MLKGKSVSQGTQKIMCETTLTSTPQVGDTSRTEQSVHSRQPDP